MGSTGTIMKGCMVRGSASVDIVILTYGDYSGLERTVDSVIAQDYQIRSVILSDDGSGAAYPKTILHKLEKLAFRTIVRAGTENLGTVAHMNRAAALSGGDYLKFIAVGDAFSDSGALSALMNFARNQNAPVVTSNAVVCSADLRRRYYEFPGASRGGLIQRAQSRLFPVLAQANIISALGTLLRKDFFEDLGGFDESYRLLEDWPAWLRLTRESHAIAYLPRVTGLYALGGVSSRQGNAFRSPALRRDMLLCYEKEILPYLSLLAPKERRVALYSYDKLRQLPSGVLLRRYFFLAAKDALKQGAKSCLLKFQSGKEKEASR